ncbi:MAG: hypothetical protein DRR06_09900 [Gammaproteobacteria bacterium]|nr:MAG: hypothetical protein DRR06_09900 [Gammaproteobacteria bacterium]
MIPFLSTLNHSMDTPVSPEDAPQSTNSHRLMHDSPDCEWWTANATVLSLMHEEELLVLEMVGMRIGDWDGDEAPNCPLCGENLYIETPDGQLIQPKVWFEQVEVEECDRCGEMGATEDGEAWEVGSRSYPAVDPPEQHWVCESCKGDEPDGEPDDNYDEYPKGFDGR